MALAEIPVRLADIAGSLGRRCRPLRSTVGEASQPGFLEPGFPVLSHVGGTEEGDGGVLHRRWHTIDDLLAHGQDRRRPDREQPGHHLAGARATNAANTSAVAGCRCVDRDFVTSGSAWGLR